MIALNIVRNFLALLLILCTCSAGKEVEYPFEIDVSLQDTMGYCYDQIKYFSCYKKKTEFKTALYIPYHNSCAKIDLKYGPTYVFCSIAPNRLYTKRGSNTSIIAQVQIGTPHDSYFECIAVKLKKDISDKEKNMVYSCTGRSDNSGKPVEKSFNAKDIPITYLLSKYYVRCSSERRDENYCNVSSFYEFKSCIEDGYCHY